MKLISLIPLKLPLLLFLVLPPAPVSARDAGEGEGDEREVSGRRVWLVATAIPEEIDNPVSVMAGGQMTEVTLSRRMASSPVKIPADGVIRLVRPVDPPPGPGEPAFVTLASATIPDSVARAMILLVPAPPEDAPTVFRTRVQDLAGFRGGDTLYMNLTNTDVAVRLGKAEIPLRPGAIRIHQARDLSESTNTPVSYHFRHPTEERWKLLSASTVVLHPTRREICVFSIDPRYKRIDYHGITFPVTP